MEPRVKNFLSSQACSFGEQSSIPSISSSLINSSTQIQPENPFRVLLDMAKPNKVDESGDSNLIYDLELNRWVKKKDKAATPQSTTIKQSNTINPTTKPMAESSSKDPISSLFAERAARFANTEEAARSAEREAKKAARIAEEARLKARRERVERLAQEQLEEDKEKRGKDWDRKAYEETVRAKAVMEVERKKKEDVRERERIKRNIADDEERRRLQRERVESKYGRRLS